MLVSKDGSYVCCFLYNGFVQRWLFFQYIVSFEALFKGLHIPSDLFKGLLGCRGFSTGLILGRVFSRLTFDCRVFCYAFILEWPSGRCRMTVF